jgi:hypothetical protein
MIDASAGPARKHAKVSSRKAVAPKSPAAPKGMGAASSKDASSHTRSVPKADAPPKASVPPKGAVPLEAAMPKSAATQAVPTAGVLRISNGVKRPSSVEPPQVPKGKQAMVNVARLLPPPQFAGLLHGRSLRLNMMTAEWRFVRCLRHRLWCCLPLRHQVTLLVQSLLWLHLCRSPICSFLQGFKTYGRCWRLKRLIRQWSPSKWGLALTPPLVCFCTFCDVILPILSSLTFVAKVLMMAAMPTLAFVRWSRDNHQRGLWTEMRGRSLTASNM